MDNEIDLGVSPKESGIMPLTEAIPLENKMPEKTYPHFHYSGPKELELPDEGEMTICFKKTSETSSTRSDGSHWYECCIEVHTIKEVESEEPDEPTHRDRSAEEALDTLAEAISKRNGNHDNPGY